LINSFCGILAKMETDPAFVDLMFGDLPRFFKDEDQLREIGSDPITREKLLQDFSDDG
jgi:type I restriction enzyme R subunit